MMFTIFSRVLGGGETVNLLDGLNKSLGMGGCDDFRYFVMGARNFWIMSFCVDNETDTF